MSKLSYERPFIQKLNTTSMNKLFYPPVENNYKERCANIHRYLDVGFDKDTIIDLNGNTNKKIKDIEIGDTLLSGAKVYGIVEIETNELFKYKLSLGNNAMEPKLYHLLTDDKIFSSNGQIIPDYNDHIDNLLNNKKII